MQLCDGVVIPVVIEQPITASDRLIIAVDLYLKWYSSPTFDVTLQRYTHSLPHIGAVDGPMMMMMRTIMIEYYSIPTDCSLLTD